MNLIPDVVMQQARDRAPVAYKRFYAPNRHDHNQVQVRQSDLTQTRGQVAVRIYDANGGSELPGEFQGRVARIFNPDAKKANNHTRLTRQFFKKTIGHVGINGSGSTINVTINAGTRPGARYTRGQVALGPGDPYLFRTFVEATVIPHEIIHGVTGSIKTLKYYGQSGSISEHYSDFLAAIALMYRRGQDVSHAAPERAWMIGPNIFHPHTGVKCLRRINKPGTAFIDNPYIGTDPQPSHFSQYDWSEEDHQGVHTNSGILNRVGYLVSVRSRAPAWEDVLQIWMLALASLPAVSPTFADFRQALLKAARTNDGHYGYHYRIIDQALLEVGL